MDEFNFPQSPQELKKMSLEELEKTAEAIRAEILSTVSKNGGHLSSNLGVVEVTLALHRVFSVPDDKIIFDVSHQSYAHKLLTGRYGNFKTLRKCGGVSGFFSPEESDADPVYQGHCGTSVSEALAFACANKAEKKDNFAVAVVGDGAFTNGIIYEALNNCADNELKLIIVLNDNEMSISRNTGGLNKQLRRMRSSSGYFRFKHGLQKALKKIPLLGKATIYAGRAIKNFVKDIVLKKNIFENLGLDYIGPVDGNDLKQTISVLNEAKTRDKCCVVHVYTKKGLGYPPAEREPDKYHAVSPFSLEEGVREKTDETFSDCFGKHIAARADEDGRICAITAAMGSGTGLDIFESAHKSNFFDVGIAEEHAVAFGAGLAAAGKIPVCAIYSTFAQRAYDQLFQDVSLSKAHFILALDRCGFVEGDGITHQGIYDYSLFSTLPGAVIYSPATFAELRDCLDRALDGSGLQIVRYPKGGQSDDYGWLYSDLGVAYTPDVQKKPTVILTYGRIASNALPLAGKNVGIIRLVKVFPVDFEEILRLAASAKHIVVVEEGIYQGGLGQKVEAKLSGSKKITVRAIDGLIKHGSFYDCCASQGLLTEQIKTLLK